MFLGNKIFTILNFSLIYNFVFILKLNLPSCFSVFYFLICVLCMKKEDVL